MLSDFFKLSFSLTMNTCFVYKPPGAIMPSTLILEYYEKNVLRNLWVLTAIP